MSKTKLNIALVGLTYPFRGGISHYTSLLYKALAEKHDVHFFSLSRQYPEFLFPGKTQIDKSNTAIEVPNISCLDSINPISWISTFKKVRTLNPDFILFSWWHPFFALSFGSVSILSKCFASIPSCFLCHNVNPHEHSLLDKLLLKIAFSGARAFVTHSEEDLFNARKIKPGINVYKNPHPTYNIFVSGGQLTQVAAKQKLKLDGKHVILFFGYIREYKGLQFALDAISLLKEDKHYHLLIVGEFYENKSKYQQKLDELFALDMLTVVDNYVPNEDVGLYFTAADIVVAPYLSATQSGIIQIAYSFLKPVVASNVGGLPEAVLDKQTGYLVPPADCVAIKNAICEFFDNKRSVEFGKNIERENEKYSWERMVKTIETMAAELK